MPCSVNRRSVWSELTSFDTSLLGSSRSPKIARHPQGLKWVGVVFAFCIAAYTGFLLGVIPSYPLWNNAVLPILFVVSALSAGLALVSLTG